jgi:hypothetical protein
VAKASVDKSSYGKGYGGQVKTMAFFLGPGVQDALNRVFA